MDQRNTLALTMSASSDTNTMEAREDIRRLSREELVQRLTQWGEPAYKARQVYEWLWVKGATSFDAMTNLSLTLRQKLQTAFEIRHLNVQQSQRSKDGTIKNALTLHDGLVVESVLIPTPTRITACVSSQVGCSLACTFCATARMKRMRNLNPDEIYDQVVAIQKQAKEEFGRPLTNIVFMGMGEPLLNYRNTLEAIDKITSPQGLGLSPRRITVSTAGIAKMIVQMADEKVRFKLALSLHSAIDAKRTALMPINGSNSLEDLGKALEYWYRQTRNRVTLEYVVWRGVNDQEEDIRALINFARKFPSKVNLIEYNAVGEDGLRQADSSAVAAYQTALDESGIPCSFRRSRGRDIDAACGQLANKTNSHRPSLPV
jgi:23S rRNA (adenine2503-C2)-methyltransferase